MGGGNEEREGRKERYEGSKKRGRRREEKGEQKTKERRLETDKKGKKETVEKKKKETRTPVAKAVSQKPTDSHGICVSDSGDMNLNGKRGLARPSLTFHLTMVQSQM